MRLSDVFFLFTIAALVFGGVLAVVGIPAVQIGDWHILLACGVPFVAAVLAWGGYKSHKARQSMHLYDSQADFEARQRTSNAGIIVRSMRDRPWDKRFRQDFICQQPEEWQPRYQDVAEAVHQATDEPRIYHERQSSGKWRPTHSPRTYSDKYGG